MPVTTGLIASGLIGGLVATVAMTAFMTTLGDDSPPPTAALWSRYLGSDDASPGDYVPQGMALHGLYGVSAGVALAVVGGSLSEFLAIGPGALATSVAWGVAWGLGLFVVGMAFWMNVVLGMDGDRRTLATMGLFHLVYGVVLGASLGMIPSLA